MGGINTYAYVGGNPVGFYDPYGQSSAAAWGLRGLGGISLFVPLPGARVFGIALILATIPGDTPQNTYMAGVQPFPNPITHGREQEIGREIQTGFPGGGCGDIEDGIRDLKKSIEWRKGDLNILDKGTSVYVGHANKIKELGKQLDKLKRIAKDSGCNPDCE